MARKPIVFLSHASDDMANVLRLTQDLRDNNVEVWLDQTELGKIGTPLVQKIQEGLCRCDFVAVWLTKKAVASRWVEREWQTGLADEIAKGRVVVLPLLAETCEVPKLLRDKVCADFKKGYSEGLSALLASIATPGESKKLEPLRVAILAGGMATRLWPLTLDLPKGLLRLAGGTLLSHLVRTVKELPNIEEIFVSVDANKANYFSDMAGQLTGLAESQVSIVEHAPVNGAIKGPVAKLRELVDLRALNPDPGAWNLVLGVDNIFTFSLTDLVSYAQERGASANVVIEKRTAPKEVGIAQTKGDRLESVLEKPQDAEEVIDTISTACYMFTGPDIARSRQYLDNLKEDSLGKFVGWVCPQSGVRACFLSSEWFDVGSRQGLLNGNRIALLRDAPPPHYLILGNYQVRKPVWIEDGVQIKNSIIGPNVFIDRGCYIQDSEISNSIIYEGCRITSCRPFEGIVAGPNSHFEGNIGAAVYGPNTKITTVG